MSVSNIEIVQKMYGAFATRDIDAVLGMLAADVEWTEPPNPYNPTAGSRRGHDGFLEWIEIGRRTEEILVLQPRKMLIDDDSVAVVGYLKCLVKATGKVYESDFVHLVTLRNGQVARFQEFFDTHAASEAFR